MFDNRINQEIYYGFFGAINDLPKGREQRDGDSVVLKYKEYKIDVDNIKKINEVQFSGHVGDITEVQTDNTILKIEKINLALGDHVCFTKDQVFACVRLS